ncbi:hypothetical protein RJT34_11575 [Clitoria ternatea]|uniref:Uncharacterized protein n=1 Tax=Clitoria ternatea TaxID=43366 RepID=A0AAN9PJN3_CLITE
MIRKRFILNVTFGAVTAVPPSLTRCLTASLSLRRRLRISSQTLRRLELILKIAVFVDGQVGLQVSQILTNGRYRHHRRLPPSSPPTSTVPRSLTVASLSCDWRKTMTEEDPKALNYIPEVTLKKRKSNEAFALRKKALFQQRNFNSRKTREFIKKPEDFIFEYRNREVDLIRLKRRVKRKLPELLNPKSKPLIVIRIQGKKEMHEKTRKALYSLGLRRRFSAVFVKPTVEVLAKLQRVEPYVTYGYPNLKSIKELIYKKGNIRIDKRKVPLTDNNIVEQELGKFGIVCIEDIVHHIENAGPLFEEVVRFLWPFELNKPAEGLKGSKALFKEGGDTGHREDVINDLINKMN